MKKLLLSFVALLLAIPAMSHNLAANSDIYFAKPSNWSAAQFMIGHDSWSEGYVMSKISNTNLYVVRMVKWDGYNQWTVFDKSGKWGGEGNSVQHRLQYAGNNIGKGTAQLSSKTLINSSSSVTSLSGHTSLNHTQTITVDGGAGDVTISSYYLSSYNAATASNGTTSCNAAYTATVTCTANAVDGYQFAGWYDGSTLLSENASYSYTAPNATKSITAKYVKIEEDTPVLSNFTASATNAAIGEVVTFTCDIENGEAANIVYQIDGVNLDGNTWTPEEIGTFTASATYEGAIAQNITITTYQEPTYQNGEIVAFFDNTNTGWSNVKAHVWTDGGNGTAWPGEDCTYLGNNLWMWKGTGNWEETAPAEIIFNNGVVSAQTSDLVFTNGGVYDNSGTTADYIIYYEGATTTVTLTATATEVYQGDEVTFTADLFKNDGYTLKFYIDEVEQTEGVTDNTFVYTFNEVGTYTVKAQLEKEGAEPVADEVSVIVNEATVFYVYLVKEGAWEKTWLYYWGDKENEWPGDLLSETETINGIEYYKHAFNNVASVNIIYNNKGDGGENNAQTSNIENVTTTTYYRLTDAAGAYESSASPFASVYDETITCEKVYYLDISKDLGDGQTWADSNAWFAAYFFNKNTDAETWVKGEVAGTSVLFYLATDNVPTRSGEDPVYTHVIFCRMNDAFSTMEWDVYDGETLIEDHVWNQTGDLTYDDTKTNVYNLTGWETAEQLAQIPSAIEGVEVADGITYAYGVVEAEGAIEVYSVNGAVVARGNDIVDLRGLNRGIYIVRNGDQVRKVVR